MVRRDASYRNSIANWQSVLNGEFAGPKKRHLLMSQDGSLGAVFRVRLAMFAAHIQPKVLAGELDISPKTVQAALEFRRRDWFFGDKIKDVLSAIRKRCRSDKSLRSSFTDTEFWFKPWKGPSAPEQFVSWLRGSNALKNALELLPAEQDYPLARSRDRNVQIDQIVEFLKSATPPTIAVVHQEEISNGLTALAVELCNKIRQTDPYLKNLPFLYLPASRHVPPHEHVSIATLVGKLNAFYDNEDIRSAMAPATHEEARAGYLPDPRPLASNAGNHSFRW